MNTPDLKKLITGFLLLAAVTSSGIFIALEMGGDPQPQPVATNKKSQDVTPLKNAFTESVPENITSQGPEKFEPIATDPKNLTEKLALRYAKEIVAANPEGPAMVENELFELNLPEKGMADMIAEVISTQDFESDLAASTVSLKITDKYSAEDVQKYFSEIQNIQNNTLASAVGKKALTSSSLESLEELEVVYDQAYQQASIISVPKPLVSFHQKFLALIYAQKKTLEISTNYENDPLKAVLVGENAHLLMGRKLDSFRKEAVNIKSASFDLQETEYTLIKTAHAQLGFGIEPLLMKIVVNTAATAAATAATSATETTERVEDALKLTWESILSIMVNRVIDIIQNQILDWIAGNGKPKFITNWKGFLQDLGDEAAGLAFQKVSNGLCGPMELELEIGIMSSRTKDTAPPRCTLSQVIENTKAFYDDFRAGGWASYGALLKPENNRFGQFIIASDYVAREESKAKEAASQEAVANDGYPGIKFCVTPGSGKKGCAEYKTITPGSAVSKALGIGMEGKMLRIVQAKRINELVGVLVNAAISRVISVGLSSIQNASGSSGNDSPYNMYSEDSWARSSFNSYQQQLNGELTSAEASTNNAATGAGVSYTSTTATQATPETILQNARTLDEEWLFLEPSTSALFDAIRATCSAPALIDATSRELTDLATIRNEVTKELESVEGLLIEGTATLLEARQIETLASSRLEELSSLRDRIEAQMGDVATFSESRCASINL